MASYDNFKHIVVTLAPEGILTVRLNRPSTKNAWHNELYLEMTQTFDQANRDPNVIVVILTGTGGFFSSGQDLKNIGDKQYAKLNMRHHPVGLFMWSMMHFEKPIIGAINGPAVGIGVTLIPHCDIVYATKDAYFSTPFARIGFYPEFVSSLLLPEIIGPSLANEMLLACKKLSAEEALRSGLVSNLYDSPEKVMEAATTIAKQICAFPSSLQTMTTYKRMIKNPARMRDLDYVFNMEMDFLTAGGKGGKSAQGAANFMKEKSKM